MKIKMILKKGMVFLFAAAMAVTGVFSLGVMAASGLEGAYLVRTEMIQEITLSETKPSLSNCHTLLDIRNCIVINNFNAKLHPQYP